MAEMMYDRETKTLIPYADWERKRQAAIKRARELPVNEFVTCYRFSLLPPDHEAMSSFSLTVEWRGDDDWAVMHMGQALDAAGNWQYEHLPSNRSDAFKRAFRHDLETAKRLAREKLPTLTVNNMTADYVLEHTKERSW